MGIDRTKLDEIFGPEPDDEKKPEKPVAILIQHSPDPDCLGAATGLKVILSEIYGLQAEIFHNGEVSHPQNKSMKNLLHIPLRDGVEFKPEEYKATVVLDTDLASTGFKTDEFTTVDVRIDHHDLDRDDDPKYKDVRAVGSTCSIIWEYLKEYNIDLSQFADAATAMVLGIKTDTGEFTDSGTSELDMEAYRNLLPYVDKQALANICKFNIPKHVFEAERTAYSNKRIKGTVLTSFIGQISPHDRDTIATIADRFVRMEGVNTVVIMAVVDNDLHASIRSDDSRVEVKDICHKVFGKDFGGSRKQGDMGGARVPLGRAFQLLDVDETKNKVMEEMANTISNKIFSTLGVQE